MLTFSFTLGKNIDEGAQALLTMTQTHPVLTTLQCAFCANPDVSVVVAGAEQHPAVDAIGACLDQRKSSAHVRHTSYFLLVAI